MGVQSLPVNPSMLRWARETAGLNFEEVAHRLKRKSIDTATVKAWEDGDGSPSYSQLEKLAYSIYGRPLAIFFFPEPPTEPTPRESFRTLPSAEIDRLGPQLVKLLRRARVLQINVAELNDQESPVSQPLLGQFKYPATKSVDRMVLEVRQSLGIDVDTQRSWQDTEEAFKQWRTALEDAGIAVFKDAFRIDELSGFCLYDKNFPVVYVNNSKPDTRQVFTLFHELAHLLFGTGGVDTRIDSYVGLLRGDAKVIEVKCNQFAAEFLVPRRDFVKWSSGVEATERNIHILAQRYHVSREVILRKFLDSGEVSRRRYAELAEKWLRERRARRGGGGNFYWNQRAYLGKKYLELAFGRYYQGRISRSQLADYIGVKAKLVAGMEAALLG